MTIIFKHHSLKPFGKSAPNFIRSPLGKGEKVYINVQGHMTKMAATSIYGKINRTAMNRNRSNQKPNPALETKMGNK